MIKHIMLIFLIQEMRKLKFHEQKLLKKVDFLEWKSDNNVRETTVMRRYHIQNREDYSKYVETLVSWIDMSSYLLHYLFGSNMNFVFAYISLNKTIVVSMNGPDTTN